MNPHLKALQDLVDNLGNNVENQAEGTMRRRQWPHAHIVNGSFSDQMNLFDL